MERRKIEALEGISSRIWWCSVWLFIISVNTCSGMTGG